MIKRVFILLVVLLLMAPLAVHADAIVDSDNNFYKRNQKDIIYLGRSFAANGESGSVPVKNEPASKSDMARLQNGTIIYIQYSCLYDGDFWGFTYEYSGWVKLNQMLVLYDYVAFEEAHFDELYIYSGDYAKIKETRAAIAWPWSGSDAPLWTVEDLDAENFRVSYAYLDDEGREWGFVTYLYGGRNIWVCLSEPLNRDMPVFNPATEPRVWVSETAHIDIKQNMQGKESYIFIIVVMVAALVAVTALLIRILWKPAISKPEEENDD